MRKFGKGTRPARKIKREDFELTVERDGRDETHRFTVAPRLSVNEMNTAVAAQHGDAGGAIQGILRMIRQNLVNDDGVPAQWAPLPLPLPPVAPDVEEAPWLSEEGDLSAPAEPDRDTHLPSFRGPDGGIYLMTDQDALDKFTAFEAGSSRRRWLDLIERQDDVTVEAEDLVAMAQWIIELAAERPTAPSGR